MDSSPARPSHLRLVDCSGKGEGSAAGEPPTAIALPAPLARKLHLLASSGGGEPQPVEEVISKALDALLEHAADAPSVVNKRRQVGSEPPTPSKRPAAQSGSSLWQQLPDPVAAYLSKLLCKTAAGITRAKLLRVCRGWAKQLCLLVDEAPLGHTIANRRCCWALCGSAGGGVASFQNLRALSLGLNRLPSDKLKHILIELPRLEKLDLHFLPTFHPTSPSHLECFRSLPVPSLGLQFRCSMLSVRQLQALGELPNLHRLSYKVHRMQATPEGMRSHSAALQAITQLKELALRVSLDPGAESPEGFLDSLAALPCLTSIKVRTFMEPLELDRARKLGVLPRLTSLRHLDIDGYTDFQPAELVQLRNLQQLESLVIRNSAFLHACDLTSLAPLTRLQRLDFSLHTDYKDLARDEGEEDEPDEALDGEGDWQNSEPLFALASMKQLTDLDLGDRSSLHLQLGRRLEFLTELTALTKLNLKNTLAKRLPHSAPLNIDAIAHLTNLKALNLEGYMGKSFSVLHSLPYLHHVCLRSCRNMGDRHLTELCTALPGLAILDVLGCPLLSPHGARPALLALPALWAVAIPGQALDIGIVDLLKGMPELAHLTVSRPNRASLDGVNCGAVHGGLTPRKRHIAGDLVRRYLTAELPGKLREHLQFYRNGFLDHADWDKWWVTEDEYEDQETDRDVSDSETDASDLYSDTDDTSGDDASDDDDGMPDDVLPFGPGFQLHPGGDESDEGVNPVSDSDSDEDDEEYDVPGHMAGFHAFPHYPEGSDSDDHSSDDNSSDDGPDPSDGEGSEEDLTSDGGDDDNDGM